MLGAQIIYTFGATIGVPARDAINEDTLYAIAESWFAATVPD